MIYLLFCLNMGPHTRLRRYWLALAVNGGLVVFAGAVAAAQQAVAPPVAKAPAAAGTAGNPEFLATADEVLQEMSQITGWELKSPLKKSIKSREEIHAYILRQMDDEKDAKERYASGRTAEAFGLIPKDFNLDAFLVDLLTEQIAGLYDPKAHEFYIADWIPVDEQKMVMSHELTHALEDQHFDIEPWVHAARPNDDAEMARESVLEGSAMAAMLEYTLKDRGIKLKDLPEFDPSVFVGDLADTPLLKKAPPFIKDSLMFPYFSGLSFSMSILKSGGWPAFAGVFARPPANTQQILHPEMYRANKVPARLKLDLPAVVPGENWTLLEENSLGELGWQEVLKQFAAVGHEKAVTVAWDGDTYATFEQKGSKRLMLFTRLRLEDEGAAARFFGDYSGALEKKFPERKDEEQGRNYRSFYAGGGGVFLRCHGTECVTLEGGDAMQMRQWMAKIGWEAEPDKETPQAPAAGIIKTAQSARETQLAESAASMR